MHRALKDSLLGVRHRVCGYDLKPFCYDHFEALDAAGIQFFDTAKRLTSPQIMAACRICACDGRRLEQDFPSAKTGWRDMLTHARHSLRRGARDADLLAFSEYLADYVSVPQVWRKQSNGESYVAGNAKVPTMFGILTSVLIAYKGAISEERARSMPLGLLLHYHELAGYHNGQEVKFVDDDENEAAT